MPRRNDVLRIAFSLALLGLTTFAIFGKLQAAVGHMGAMWLQSKSDAYLSDSFQKAAGGFTTVSLVKAGIDLVDDTDAEASIGVGGKVKVGDVVNPVDDYVDVLWSTMLVSCVALTGLKFLLLQANEVAFCTLIVSMAAGFISFTLSWARPKAYRFRNASKDLFSVAIVSTIVLYYLVPLSILGASMLSRTITSTTHDEAEKSYQKIQSDLFPDNDAAKSGWLSQLKSAPARAKQVFTYLTSNAEEIAEWTFKEIAAYLFDCLVFPLTLFLILYKFTRGLVAYILARGSSRKGELGPSAVRGK